MDDGGRLFYSLSPASSTADPHCSAMAGGSARLSLLECKVTPAEASDDRRMLQ
jgi:hypothetical protein